MKISQNLMVLFISTSVMGLTACETLMTRTDVREVEQKRQMQDQVVNLQRTHADTNNRFSDIESDLRSMTGRLEVVENKLQRSDRDRENLKALAENSSADSSKKLVLIQEEMLRLQEQVSVLTTELNAMKAALAANAESMAAANAEKAAAKKDLFEQAEESFDKKEWRKAILNYQKYRDANGKSKRFPEATYKIGVSFQELGMKDEAKTFFDEVVSKFPKSSEAKKAKTRLKSLR